MLQLSKVSNALMRLTGAARWGAHAFSIRCMQQLETREQAVFKASEQLSEWRARVLLFPSCSIVTFIIVTTS